MRKRPCDTVGLASLIVDMARCPATRRRFSPRWRGSSRSRPERAKSAKARAASQPPERRSEIAKKAAAARWEGRAQQSAE